MTYKTYMIKFERENGTIGADQFCATSSFGALRQINEVYGHSAIGPSYKILQVKELDI